VAVRLPVAPRALVVAAAIPLLFLHSKFQPSVSIALHGTSLDAYLSDFAVAAVVLTAAAVGLRDGWSRLAAGRPLWWAASGFFVWVAFEVAWGHHVTGSYATASHLATAMKFLEYALLAPSVALIVRRRLDLLTLLWSLVLWSCCATVAGIAEFFGSPWPAKGAVGHRQASFLSPADFSALSAAALLVGLVALTFPRLRLGRALGRVAVVSGVLGTIIAGAMASALGLVTAGIVVAIVSAVRRELDLRRASATALAALVAVAGVLVIRGHDLSTFARFLGASSQPESPDRHVETYAHHTLLVWFGYRIWLDHPVLGVGWEGSAEPANFVPLLPAAHRRFPDEAALAFPAAAPDRRYGVQNVWIAALADLGIVGFLLWVCIFAAAVWLAVRRNALLALAWVALAAWLWSAQSFVAGIPLDALTWLAFGLAAVRLDPE
jgi:O-antigen ligase